MVTKFNGVHKMHHNIIFLTHDPHVSPYHMITHINSSPTIRQVTHMTLLIPAPPLSGQYLHMKGMPCGLLIQDTKQVNNNDLVFQQDVSPHTSESTSISNSSMPVSLSRSTCTVEGIL